MSTFCFTSKSMLNSSIFCTGVSSSLKDAPRLSNGAILPLTFIFPLLGDKIPQSNLRNVVLPTPFLPITPTISPLLSSIEQFFIMFIRSIVLNLKKFLTNSFRLTLSRILKSFVTFFNSITAIIFPFL